MAFKKTGDVGGYAAVDGKGNEKKALKKKSAEGSKKDTDRPSKLTENTKRQLS